MCDGGPRDDNKKPLWLGLKGQECFRHNIRQTFRWHWEIFFPDSVVELFKYASINNHLLALKDDLSGYLPALQYYLSAGKMMAFDYTSIIKVLTTWPSRTSIRYFGFKLYSLGQNVNSDRKRFASKVGRVHLKKLWSEPKSIQNIQVFFKFANFYQQFTQGFSRITIPLTLIFKTSGNTESII